MKKYDCPSLVDPDSLDSKRRFNRSPQMAWRSIAGEMVLLNVEGKELFGLNRVGARVWELLDGNRSIEEIAEAIAKDFGVPPERADDDVRAFLAELLEAGALA